MQLDQMLDLQRTLARLPKWKLALANHRGAASVRAAKRAHTAKAAIARRKLKQSKPKPQLKGLDDIRAVNSFK